MKVILSEEIIESISSQLKWLCHSIENCDDCPMANRKGECQVLLPKLEDGLKYIMNNNPPTNGEKFQEVFGFPVYELHQLSMQEEGDWVDKIYEGNVSKVD